MNWLRWLVLTCCLLMTSCFKSEQPIRIGTILWPGYEPLYLARELGTIKKSEVRLIEYPSASDVIKAFKNGTLEGASLTLDELLLLKQNHIPVTAILVQDISNGADAIISNPEINSMKGLKNKTIGVERGALGAYILTRALQIHLLPLDNIRIKNVAPSTHEMALTNKEVDAIVTFEPIKSKLMALGANEVFNSSEIPGEIVDVLVVRNEILQTRQDTLQKLVDAWFNALDYMVEKPNQAYTLIGKRLNISLQQVAESYNGLKLPSRQENQQLLSTNPDALHKSIQSLHEVMIVQNLLRSAVSTQNIYTDRFVKP